MTDPGGDDAAALREGLAVLGLSDTEIETYLALLTRGEATTRAVAADTDVTQRAVYDIVERLADRGLVRVNDHASPTTIRALSPTDSISQLTERLDSITPALEDRFTEAAPRAPEIRMVKSRETAIKRLRESIAAAEREVALSIPEPIYPEIESDLRGAVERGVFVLLLLGDATTAGADAGGGDVDGGEDGNGDESRTESRFAGVADVVRYWDEGLVFLSVADDAAAMIGDPDLLSGTHTAEEAVVVTQRNLAGSIMGLHLSGYWPAATETFVIDPDPLPATFEWFREALLHATLHRQAGTDLRAEVVTTDGESFSGSVVEIRQALVEPATNEFTLEASMAIDTGDGVVTIGGRGSFVEDYEADSISLRRDP